MSKEEAGGATGTGTDSLEIKPVDPNAGRKAIMAKQAAMVQAEMEIDLQTVPGAAELQGGYAQEEGAATPDGDAVGDGALQPPRAAAAEEQLAPAPDSGVDSAPQTPEKPAGEENVTLKVFGKEIVEPRSVVEAAGGVEARRIQLAVQHRLDQAEELARRDENLRLVAAEKRREYEERLRSISKPAAQAQPEPASPQARPAAPTQSADIDALVANAITEIYSGDPDRATVALSEVLRERTRTATIDPAEISALVQAKVDSDLAARDSKNAATEQINAVNELMESKYSVLLEDPILRVAAAGAYNAAIKDPRNKGRPLVKIADEVGTLVMNRIGGVSAPDADVTAKVNTRTNFKRRIPQPSSASDRVPAEPAEPKYPTKPSDVINQMRAARHQPLLT